MRISFDFERRIAALEKLAAERRFWRLLLPLLRSRYLLISLAFYLSLLLIFAGYQLSAYIATEGSFEAGTVLMLPPAASPPPSKPQPETKAETKEVKVTTATASTLKTEVKRITTMAPSQFVRPETPSVAPAVTMVGIKMPTEMTAKINAARIARLQGVAKFQEPWKVVGQGKQTRATFTIYKAKYQDGDWNCNPSDLHNLMLQIRRWSKDRLDASMKPEAIDVGSDQLFTIKPPFVYLTGHKDFHFQTNEVTNLRDYLLLGGCIWADTALAGRRSRFDVAFRREIARVLPDRDFEIVPEGHEMFSTFFEKIGLPSGMNYYDEPVEMINIDDKLAVLYTLNGYGHLWEARLNSEGKIEWKQIYVGKPEDMGKKKSWRYWSYVYGPHLAGGNYQRIIYRNLNDETTRNAYKFGINVVVHLLTRYQRDLMLLPKELPAGPSDSAKRLEPKTLPTTNEAAAATNAPAKEEKEEAAPKPGTIRIKTKQSERNF